MNAKARKEAAKKARKQAARRERAGDEQEEDGDSDDAAMVTGTEALPTRQEKTLTCG